MTLSNIKIHITHCKDLFNKTVVDWVDPPRILTSSKTSRPLTTTDNMYTCLETRETVDLPPPFLV